MILEFDLGNSSTKWRVLEGRDVVARGRGEDLAGFEKLPLTRIRVASVAEPQRDAELVRWCESELALSPEFARSTAACAGVINAYAEPERLGVDRWLAILAAFNRYSGPVLVIDAGTALTLDFVDGNGCHHGGFILPGRELSLSVLRRDTSRVRFSGDQPLSQAPGVSTEEAVLHGVLFSQCAVIEEAMRRAHRLLGVGVTTVMAGGDAPALLDWIDAKDQSLEYCPDLVFDGLALVLP